MTENAKIVHPSLLMDPEDLALELRISIRSIWRRASDGQIPRPIRIGRATRWRRDEIEAWIAAGCPDGEQWESSRKPADSSYEQTEEEDGQ